MHLAKGLARFDRPVFVRIGYEANGFWNGYRDETYAKAFAHIAQTLREHAPNVATVWCVHPVGKFEHIMRFRPEAQHVDWWAIDLFEPRWLKAATTKRFLEAAHEAGKPVMIGESTPTKVNLRNATRAWKTWFSPYLSLLKRQPGIKAIFYINRDWTATCWADWGDARLERHPKLLRRWRQELAHPIFLHARAELPSRIRVLAPERLQQSPQGTLLRFNLTEAGGVQTALLSFTAAPDSALTLALEGGRTVQIEAKAQRHFVEVDVS